MSSEYDGLYVYVLRTEDMVLGVFAEVTTALEFKENFIAIYPRISPNCVETTFYIDRRLVVGGTAKGGSKEEINAG